LLEAKMISNVFGKTDLLERAISASAIRNEVISNNIANVETPNFKRSKVSFEEHLSREVGKYNLKGIRSYERHIPIGERDFSDAKINIERDNKSLSMRLDGNNVDIENEMALLAQNQLRYTALVQTLSSRYARLRSAISEGRR
jgi:flagellar basal-body rod protein FlgB